MESISSAAAEGGLLAQGVAEDRTRSTFTRVQSGDLAEQMTHEAEKLQDAFPLASWVDDPSTVAVDPRKLIALVVWFAFCSATSEVSCWFMLICCSTLANCTSCWVN